MKRNFMFTIIVAPKFDMWYFLLIQKKEINNAIWDNQRQLQIMNIKPRKKDYDMLKPHKLSDYSPQLLKILIDKLIDINRELVIRFEWIQ